ncbi:hypothetical protein [Rhodococcus sp. 11-3]|uniref:hypothetical protein n=1 Tax=Rhodococcus sp. 11-3 TaxID=2854796 RepID=UPI00203C7D82|nr:hypothetical protein [Rhodococcus sp. 11-3]USC17040.1 hypothetical protein KZJ41_09310 [Rhodococcus sp. 11-3]
MARAEITFSVDGVEEIRRVRLQLTQEANRWIPRAIDHEVMQEARQMRDKARENILAMPTPANAGHTGMRAEIAAGVRVRRMGPGLIRIGTQMSDNDEAMLPRGTDTRASGHKGWEHPFFGDRSRWYRQSGSFSWFLDAMQDGRDDIVRRLNEVLEDAADRIDRAKTAGLIDG